MTCFMDVSQSLFQPYHNVINGFMNKTVMVTGMERMYLPHTPCLTKADLDKNMMYTQLATRSQQ